MLANGIIIAQPAEQKIRMKTTPLDFGTWEVVSYEDYTIVIEEDRTAATNWPHSDRGVDGMVGSWVRQGSNFTLLGHGAL